MCKLFFYHWLKAGKRKTPGIFKDRAVSAYYFAAVKKNEVIRKTDGI